jgi:copper oxidase (laccase) domain-containing protein
MAFRSLLSWTSSLKNLWRATPTLIKQRQKSHARTQHQTRQYSTTSSRPYKNFPRRSLLALLGLAGGGTVAYSSRHDTPLQKHFEKLKTLHATLTNPEPENKNILTIPGLPQSTRIAHGITTTEAGNVGFVTLKDGATPAQLTTTIQHVLNEIHTAATNTQHDTGDTEPFLIVNETAYANASAPGLAKTDDGKAIFITTLTEENIGAFIEKNRFSADGQFAGLRDKCISVVSDGFVSNVSHYQGKQLYFAASTADAAPVILFDETTGIIGVMPCPWHAVCKRTFDTLIEKMKALGAKPENIQMGIGPGLGPNSYEFSKSDAPNFYQPDVMDKRDGIPFQGRASLKSCIHEHSTDPTKCLLDMPSMLKTIALEQGLSEKNIQNSGWNTMEDTRFFSARRMTPAAKQPEEAKKLYPKTSREIAYVSFFSPKPPIGTQNGPTPPNHPETVKKQHKISINP